MAAALVGYDPAQSEGVFTFGGTGGLLYGMKVGLEKALPGSARSGVRGEAAVLVSDCSHYACRTVAAWLGIGQDHVIAVPTHADNSMNVTAFEAAARDVLKSGRRIAAIVATLGTTDAFGLDDLAAIHAVRNRLIEEFKLPYQPHLHADAVIGWAWSVFNDYDFLANPLGFRGRTVRRWRRRSIAFGICRWPIRSASIFTKPASRRTFRRSRCFAAAKICNRSPGNGPPCRICFSRASTIRACSRWKPRARVPGRWRRWPA